MSFPLPFVNHSLMNSSHPFGSRRDRSILPELKCGIYKLQLLTSVLCPDFWDYVPCRKKRIPNPWLKSLCKAQHCLLQRKKNPGECLFKTVNIPTSLLISLLLPFAALFFYDKSVGVFHNQHTSSCFLFFFFNFISVFLQRNFSAPDSAFESFFLEECLLQIHVALCWKQSKGLLSSTASLALLWLCLNICI